MKRKQVFLFLILFVCFFRAFSQTKTGVVEVVKDPLIDSLIARRVAVSKGISGNGSPLVIYGYRVQIFFGTDRKEAYNEQARFKFLYPELNTYISYTQPNYRVKIGDFRTRMEAQKVMNELRVAFKTLFIFSEKINPPKIEDTNAER